MAVPVVLYGSEIWKGGKQEGKNLNAEIMFLRSVAGYTREDQIINIKIR
jgi:hypothetical protein